MLLGASSSAISRLDGCMDKVRQPAGYHCGLGRCITVERSIPGRVASAEAAYLGAHRLSVSRGLLYAGEGEVETRQSPFSSARVGITVTEPSLD